MDYLREKGPKTVHNMDTLLLRESMDVIGNAYIAISCAYTIPLHSWSQPCPFQACPIAWETRCTAIENQWDMSAAADVLAGRLKSSSVLSSTGLKKEWDQEGLSISSDAGWTRQCYRAPDCPAAGHA